MKVTIRNTDAFPVPVYSCDGATVLRELQPGEQCDVDDEDVTLLNLGHNPSFIEEFREGLEAFGAALKAMLSRLLGMHHDPQEAASVLVSVSIENHGPHELRVLLGSNLDERTVAVGEELGVSAPGYVEIRELGVGADPMPNP